MLRVRMYMAGFNNDYFWREYSDLLCVWDFGHLTIVKCDDIVMLLVSRIKQGLFHPRVCGAIRIESLFNLDDIKIRD